MLNGRLLEYLQAQGYKQMISKWDFPVWKRITGKEPWTLKFVLKFFVLGLAFKLIVINGVGILFFGMEPLPILRVLGL